MSNSSLVSIIVPNYNRSSLLDETLESILAQTYPRWECLVVDDGSTDNSVHIVEHYTNLDNRFMLIRRDRSPKGASTCRNIGLSKAKGEYVIFFDSDDLFTKECLEYRVNIAIKYPDYDGWVFPTGVFQERIGDRDVQWNYLCSPEDDLIRFLRQDMPWHTSGVLWKNTLNHREKWFDEDALSFQDWEMHINKLLAGFKYLKIDEGRKSIHTYYRKNTGLPSISSNNLNATHLINRTATFKKIIERCLNLQNADVNFEITKLLFRNSAKLLEHGLVSEAKQLWELNREYQLMNSVSSHLWWTYLSIKIRYPGWNNLLEFVAYKVFRKHSFLNTESTFLTARTNS